MPSRGAAPIIFIRYGCRPRHDRYVKDLVHEAGAPLGGVLAVKPQRKNFSRLRVRQTRLHPALHALQPAQKKAPKAEHLFNPPEERLRVLL